MTKKAKMVVGGDGLMNDVEISTFCNIVRVHGKHYFSFMLE